MKTLELNQMEIIEGGEWSWACTGAAIGLVSVGIAVSTVTAGTGALAAGGMILSAFSTGGSLASCAYNW